MTEQVRHVYGPRPLGNVLTGVTRPALRKRAGQAAGLIADWEAIAGPRMAALAVPRRLSAGTLTLACSGPVALELQHQATLLIERINTHLGRDLVQRLRFVQEETRLVRARTVPDRRPAPAAVVEIEGLALGPLRDALQALGQRIAERQAPPTRGTRRTA